MTATELARKAELAARAAQIAAQNVRTARTAHAQRVAVLETELLAQRASEYAAAAAIQIRSESTNWRNP